MQAPEVPAWQVVRWGEQRHSVSGAIGRGALGREGGCGQGPKGAKHRARGGLHGGFGASGLEVIGLPVRRDFVVGDDRQGSPRRAQATAPVGTKQAQRGPRSLPGPSPGWVPGGSETGKRMQRTCGSQTRISLALHGSD